MYYNHFGLKEPPFKITPNTEMFFTGSNRGAVLDALLYAIGNGEGIIKVVGEVGSGKTMLCRMLQTMLPGHIESIYLANPSVAPEDVLHAIAFELQLRLPKNADRLKVMQKLQEYLLKRHEAGRQVVIFVEEAQGMPLATLEEIRLLSNLETKHDKLLQIVLFGQPELDANLNQTHIRQLRERITHSFNLAPLQPKEVDEYLMFRMRAAGYHGPPPFTPAAIKKLAQAAQGLVRRVNILADKSLLAAFAENVYQITPKHVQAAITDSEFSTEKIKPANKSGFLAWVVVLGAGLLLGLTAAYFWYQPNGVSDKPKVAAIKPVPRPVVTIKPVAAPATAPSAVQAPISMPPAQPDVLAARLSATEAWLVTQQPSVVTIQLFGANDEQQLKLALERLGSKIELDKIYVYRTLVNSQPAFNVIYSGFPDRAEATRVLETLPEELKKNRPQLRTVAGIMEEVAKTK